MAITTEIENRVKRLNEKFTGYIPPRDRWTPVDESVCQPADPLQVPMEEAQAMQFNAIKYAFTRQCTFNKFYHRLCDNRGVTSGDVKTSEDLERVPLTPDATFKTHPSGEDFAHWIANVYTGELPTVVIEHCASWNDRALRVYILRYGVGGEVCSQDRARNNGASEREDAQGPGAREARARRCRRHTRVQLGRKAEDGDHVTG